ncbi:hypothetical protein [Prosthecomicrobium hirschii]|uniref:hypothetical protein n=1 Tax=Prosthecodimorpha hirschii TaxID=665126 RepID=UPI00112BEE68|nr:hypothetical protein [Prosthecomicrobium hirschii]MCW1841574.1 hypothetical protein [Prosthecomicrobium hirschii]
MKEPSCTDPANIFERFVTSVYRVFEPIRVLERRSSQTKAAEAGDKKFDVYDVMIQSREQVGKCEFPTDLAS